LGSDDSLPFFLQGDAGVGLPFDGQMALVRSSGRRDRHRIVIQGLCSRYPLRPWINWVPDYLGSRFTWSPGSGTPLLSSFEASGAVLPVLRFSQAQLSAAPPRPLGLGGLCRWQPWSLSWRLPLPGPPGFPMLFTGLSKLLPDSGSLPPVRSSRKPSFLLRLSRKACHPERTALFLVERTANHH